MMNRKLAAQLVERYIGGWEQQDLSTCLSTLSPDIFIAECNGMAYQGIEQVPQWFTQWHASPTDGRVTKWEITNLIYDQTKNVAAVEWEFECVTEGHVSSFLGASLFHLDDTKIVRIHEYQMDKHRNFPFEHSTSGINFSTSYQLGERYESVKQNAVRLLNKYLDYPNLIAFDDVRRTVTFTSERLIPIVSTGRPRIMLLFSNPHPYSVHQGMFLSPNTRGRENDFWPVMKAAGWLSIPERDRNPKQLADICLRAKYQGPFELIFYCYYAFPTNYPKDLRKIFGRQYLYQVIAPQSMEEFRHTVQDTSAAAVVAFNKGVFNLASEEPIESYIERLKRGELIQSQVKDMDKQVPIFLTYPTGWRYHSQYRQLRRASLESIMAAILAQSPSQ